MVRQTTTAPSGAMEAKNNWGSAITMDTKDDNDDESNSGDESDDDDDATSSQDEQPAEEAKKGKPLKKKQKQLTKNKRKKNCGCCTSQHGCMGIDEPWGVINPGTQINVISSPGWHFPSQVDNVSAQLDGALTGVGERALLLVRAVTACTVLLKELG